MTAVVNSKTAPIKVLMLDSRGEYFDWASKINQGGRHWDVLRVDNNKAMLSFLSESKYHAVVVASSTRIHADQDCLVKAINLQPRALRILLPGMPLSRGQQNRTQDLVHRVYSDQQPLEEVAEGIENLIKINRLLYKQKNREYINSLGQLPSPPKVYKDLNEALSSDQSNATHISRIIGQDPALAAKVLSVVNSAYFGLDRKISNITESVTLLGIRMLRALALSGHLVSLYPQQRNWSYFSFESLNQRSMLVARLAHQICRDLKASQAIQDQAFIGGLLHDLGVLVMASQDPQLYRKIMVISAQKKAPLCSVEKKMLGLFHGEVGAYLLAHWKLPAAVIEAVLLHHTPQLSPGSEFSPLTAVHIADSLLAEAETEIGANLSNTLSMDYLKRVGVDKEIPRWKITANLYQNSK
ncbi:HDOD domain-containing protein [Motiliproteus sp. MSK22-1]|uniref:HDOD domain-containing protein n=1 Tax=Motiliproteus sp. MSK22-1 TaxID=1897630 RepID=UPI000976DACD|nr:HDOD domain-containing protein [Motiliproteus sp. MSK22-1]OMH38856.1 hypothetical protein BGP75_00310 [Motiliproteus sp. MSK22-1]